MQIPPELMTPEQREERALAVEREIGREWLKFAITEFVVISVPLGIFLYVYVVKDTIPDRALAPVMIVGGWLLGLLVTYWIVRRSKPLQDELKTLREG